MLNDNVTPRSPSGEIGAPTACTAPPSDARSNSARRQPAAIPMSPAASPTDNFLVGKYREGDQNAATQLYFRYARRLTALVKSRCSADLARVAGVEDIVQSVFKTLFQRIGKGYYDIPDRDELWKLLLVITLNKIRPRQLTLTPSSVTRGAARTLRWLASALKASSACGRPRQAMPT